MTPDDEENALNIERGGRGLPYRQEQKNSASPTIFPRHGSEKSWGPAASILDEHLKDIGLAPGGEK